MRNKKRTSIIVAAFMTVFLAGSAFAFSNLDPLIWNGTASVNADIRLEIVDYNVVQDDTGAFVVLESAQLDGTQPGLKIVNFTIGDPGNNINGFTTPGQVVEVDWDIRNVGTMWAEIDARVEILFEDGVVNPALITTISGWGELTDTIEPAPAVNDPTNDETLTIHVEFDPAFDPGTWTYTGVYTFQLRLYYTPYLP